MPKLTVEERKKLYLKLGNKFLSEIFSYLEDPEPFIDDLSADKAADIVESMPADITPKNLKNCSPNSTKTT